MTYPDTIPRGLLHPLPAEVRNPGPAWWPCPDAVDERDLVPFEALPCGCHIRRPDFEAVLCPTHLLELNGADMAQRYTDPTALARMAEGKCPECGNAPEQHLDDNRFWLPRGCDLLPVGVAERIDQFEADQKGSEVSA